MQIIDPSALTVLLTLVGVAAVAGVLLSAVALVSGLSVTRTKRLARHESIPTFYGRLHFAS